MPPSFGRPTSAKPLELDASFASKYDGNSVLFARSDDHRVTSLCGPPWLPPVEAITNELPAVLIEKALV